MFSRIVAIILLICFFIAVTTACNGNPGLNPGGQPPSYTIHNPFAIADGSGGAIITYQIRSDTSTNTFVQLIDQQGTLQWGVKGNELVTFTGISGENDFTYLTIDDDENVIVVYVKNQQLMAKKLNSEGQSVWPENSRLISPDYDYPVRYLKVTDDESGEMVTVWVYEDNKLYVQKLDDAMDIKWSVPVDTPGISKFNITADESGNVYILWKDNPQHSEGNYFVQKINPAGVDSWNTRDEDGIHRLQVDTLGIAYLGFGSPITNDGAGGAVISWVHGILDENQKLITAQELYAQRFDEQGRKMWGEQGVLISTRTKTGYLPHIICQKTDNIFTFWTDTQGVYAQRLDANGNVVWEQEIQIGNGGDRQEAVYYSVTGDDEEGAVIVWNRTENGNSYLYAQRIDANGTLLWGNGGTRVSKITPYWAGSKSPARVVTDGTGGFIVTWAGGDDIYQPSSSWAQRISYDGDVIWGEAGVQLDSFSY